MLLVLDTQGKRGVGRCSCRRQRYVLGEQQSVCGEGAGCLLRIECFVYVAGGRLGVRGKLVMECCFCRCMLYLDGERSELQCSHQLSGHQLSSILLTHPGSEVVGMVRLGGA